jgi:hypothetical protein
MTKPKAKQTELKGMPKRDALGKAASKYIKLRDKLADAKEDLLDQAATVVKLMREKRRKQIKVDGVNVTLKHVESQDLLKISKPKEK